VLLERANTLECFPDGDGVSQELLLAPYTIPDIGTCLHPICKFILDRWYLAIGVRVLILLRNVWVSWVQAGATLAFLWLETLRDLLEERHLLDGPLEGCNNKQCFEVELWISLDGSTVVEGLLIWNAHFSKVN
jgi:hypothetical protein